MEKIIFTNITIDELAALFDHRIDLAFQRNTRPKERNVIDVQFPDIMDTRECSRYVGRERATLRRLCSKGCIPHVKRGGRIYFDRKEIDGWLMSGTRRTSTPPPAIIP